MGSVAEIFSRVGGQLKMVIQHNPGPSLCVVIFGLGFGLVGSNAMYYQPVSHPTPFVETRDSIVTKSVPHNRAVKDQPSYKMLSSIDPAKIPVPTAKAARHISSVSETEQKTAKVAVAAPADIKTVKTLQLQLTDLNLYHGEIDGIFGDGTKSAVTRLQGLLGMPKTGEIDEELSSLLALSSASRSSNSSPSVRPALVVENDQFDQQTVKAIQKGLSRFGIDGIEVDGVYGSQTASAIKAFQQRYQLTVDGRPTSEVLNKLKNIGAITDS